MQVNCIIVFVMLSLFWKYYMIILMASPDIKLNIKCTIFVSVSSAQQ